MPQNSAAGLTAGQTGSEQDITAAEREQALSYIAETRERMAQAVKNLSESQWTFKPAQDRWSVFEILEHVVVTSELVIGTAFPQLESGPPPAPGRDAKATDDMILETVPKALPKIAAPGPLVPTGRWRPSETLDRFHAACGELASFLESKHDLRGHSRPHPVLGPLDGYQWILLTVAHADRHARQVLEVAADPNFPGGSSRAHHELG